MDLSWGYDSAGAVVGVTLMRRCSTPLYEFERFTLSPPLTISILTINVGSRAWRMGVRLQSTQDSDITLPSQSRLSPGNYICMCYLASSVGLAQIAGHIFQTFYSVPQQRGILGPQTPGIHRISRRTIAHLNSELIRRRHDVPPHLRITIPLSSARSPSLTSASDIPSPQ
jgi:hypothetical protein